MSTVQNMYRVIVVNISQELDLGSINSNFVHKKSAMERVYQCFLLKIKNSRWEIKNNSCFAFFFYLFKFWRNHFAVKTLLIVTRLRKKASWVDKIMSWKRNYLYINQLYFGLLFMDLKRMCFFSKFEINLNP